MDKKIILLLILAVLIVIFGLLTFQYFFPQKQEAQKIEVILPNGGETWVKGQKVEILWRAPKEIKFVNLRLEVSENNEGQNFNAAIASNILNTGGYQWTVQDLYVETWGTKTLPVSDKYLLIIEDSEYNNIYDTSDSVFTIK